MRRAVQVVDGLLSEIEQCRDEIALRHVYAEIEQARARAKSRSCSRSRAPSRSGHDLAALRLFYAVGLRVMSLTWSRRNAFGDGAWENGSRGGLTRLGRAAVAEMDRLGIVVDVSHASGQTARDVLSLARGPRSSPPTPTRAPCVTIRAICPTTC